MDDRMDAEGGRQLKPVCDTLKHEVSFLDLLSEGDGYRLKARPCHLRGTIVPEGVSGNVAWCSIGWL